jgi:uncharacterized protein (TIGR02598 family)
MKIDSQRFGFSLVEVVLAIGIASFGLLAIVGLLPVGMKSVQNASEQAAAANVANSIAHALRSAEKVSATTFSNSFSSQSIVYTIGGAPTTIVWDTLNLNGSATNTVSARLKARLVITPPSTSNTNGTALISIAWPAQSPNLVWSGSQWSNAQGHLTVGVQFLPRP